MYLEAGGSLAKARSPLERKKGIVLKLILDGLSDAQVAAALSSKKLVTSRQAITAFRHRHAPELSASVNAIVKQAEDFAIANKVGRLAELQWLYEQTKAEVEEHGLVTEKVTTAEDGGPHFSREYRAAMVKEMRGLLKDAAVELGQIATKGGDTYNIEKAVLVREVHGSGMRELG